MVFRKPEPTDKMTDHAEQHGFIYDEVGKLQNEPTVAIGDIPPTDEDSKEGDLWWDSDRMEMFILYQDAWITTNALSARVEAGEIVQAELLARVAEGEEQQENLKNKVGELDTATDTLAQQNTLQNGQIQRLSSDKADIDHLHPYAHVDDVADKDHTHDEYLTGSGNQELTQTWKLKSNSKTFMTIADDKMNIYHVADPDNATHVANRNYVDTVKEGLQSAISDLADKDHVHSDLAEKNHLHSDLADKDHVHDDYASTSVVDSILRPLTWKFMGSSTRAQDLGPGEFTISTSGSQNTSGGQWKIYLNPHDSSGRRIVAQVDFSHDFSNNFLVSVEHVGGGGGITGKSQNFYFNVDGSPNKYHRLETNWWKVAYSLSTGQEYIIQIPGLLPTYGPASSSSTLNIEEEVDGELPASDEQEEQVND